MPPASSTGPPMRSFETVGELQRVLGMSPGLFAKIADSLTVHTAAGRHQSRDGVAQRAARAAERHARIGRRATSRSARTRSRTSFPCPRLPQRRGSRTGAIAGVADPGGGDDARWCNLRPRSGPACRRGAAERPVIAVLWQEGSRAAPPDRPASAGDASPRSEHRWNTHSIISGKRCAKRAAQLGLPAFWRWWTGELAPLVPAAPRAALQRRRAASDPRVRRRRRGPVGAARGRRCAGAGRGGADSLGGDPAAIAQAGRALIETLAAAGGGRRCGQDRHRPAALAGPAQAARRCRPRSRKTSRRRSPTISTGTRRFAPISSISTPPWSAAISRTGRSRSIGLPH